LRAATPIWRQWWRAASRGRRRSAGSESDISPAPPCSAIAHPIFYALLAPLFTVSLSIYFRWRETPPIFYTTMILL
jgi:hypothetical protein